MTNWLVYVLIRISVFLLHSIPRHIRQKVVFFIARCILASAKKTRLRAINNVTNAMSSLNKKAIDSLVYKSYQNIVFGVTECFWMEDLDVDVECTEDTLRLLQNPKGCSICAMHMSCIELVPFVIQKLVGELTTLSKIPKFVKEKRIVYQRSNINVIDKNDSSSFFKLLKASRNGSPICLHGDHYTNDVDVTFFGQATRAPSGSAMISAYSKVPLLLCYAVLQTNGRYKVILETIVENHVANTRVDIVDTVEKLYRRFEQVILEYPDQWCWSYKRWREGCK